MPSDAHIETVLLDLEEKIERLGDEVSTLHGPVQDDAVEEEQKAERIDEEEEKIYYLTASTQANSRYYIAASPNWEMCPVVYPYHITTHVGNQLSTEEVSGLLSERIEWDEIDELAAREYRTEAAVEIIENTSLEECWDAKFTLLVYCSSAEVSYRVNETDNGVPLNFQTIRHIFPYNELPSLRQLYDRTNSVINMGRRGKRYVETAFTINKDGDYDEWNLHIRF